MFLYSFSGAAPIEMGFSDCCTQRFFEGHTYFTRVNLRMYMGEDQKAEPSNVN